MCYTDRPDLPATYRRAGTGHDNYCFFVFCFFQIMMDLDKIIIIHGSNTQSINRPIQTREVAFWSSFSSGHFAIISFDRVTWIGAWYGFQGYEYDIMLYRFWYQLRLEHVPVTHAWVHMYRCAVLLWLPLRSFSRDVGRVAAWQLGAIKNPYLPR